MFIYLGGNYCKMFSIDRMGLPGRNGALAIRGEHGGGTDNSAESAERLRQGSRLQGTLEHPSVQVASGTCCNVKVG